MHERPKGKLPAAVNSLSDLVVSVETLDEVLGHIGRIGVQVMDGWDAAAATLVEGDRAATYGGTDERVLPVDQGQYDAGKGPCVDASKGEVKYWDGMETPPEWRVFADQASDVGFNSVISFPLMFEDQKLGALNFYSSERSALRIGQREEGQVFAAQAATTIHALNQMRASQEQIGHLETALETRTLIGQATGILMAQEGLTSDEAFQRLVHVSQSANIKLREIASKFVETWEKKAAGG